MKLPKYTLLTTRIGSILGIVQSMIWVVLCAIGMTSYLNCSFYKIVDTPSDTFGNVIQHRYFLNSNCSIYTPEYSEEAITDSSDLFIWITLQMCFCSLWLISSIYLLASASHARIAIINSAIYLWCFTTVVVTVVDLTLGVFFGICYGSITAAMDENFRMHKTMDVYLQDLSRLAALMLMTISMRGFVMIIVNITLLIGMIVLSFDIRDVIAKHEAESQRAAPINAFSRNRPLNQTWYTETSLSELDPQTENKARRLSGQRRPENHDRNMIWLANVNNQHQAQSTETSHSWYKNATNTGIRPFSYLEETKPGVSNRAPLPSTPPVNTQPWRRNTNWESTPPDPIPDYSPIQSKRNKSALKATYM